MHLKLLTKVETRVETRAASKVMVWLCKLSYCFAQSTNPATRIYTNADIDRSRGDAATESAGSTTAAA